MDIKKLREVDNPLNIRTIIKADICRKVRNKIVHSPFSVPRSKEDRFLTNCREHHVEELEKSSWSCDNPKQVVNSTVGQFFGDVFSRSRPNPGKPIELFYALFNFTNLNRLACEIDEAIPLEKGSDDCYIKRKRSKVRNVSRIMDHNAQQDRVEWNCYCDWEAAYLGTGVATGSYQVDLCAEGQDNYLVQVISEGEQACEDEVDAMVDYSYSVCDCNCWQTGGVC